jgi:adsorption protein B
MRERPSLLLAYAWIHSFQRLTFTVSSVWVWCFAALAIILLASGLDDLIPVLICLRQWTFAPKRLADRPLMEGTAEARRIAIFVPCWKESAVIGNMVRHNLAAIRYQNYDFFLGTYPNDEPTVKEARQLADFFPNVHVAVCGQPGPTSKADCLNAVFRRMEEFEAERKTRFDTIVLHDAEDMIHPDALSLINRERFQYEMVQVPVLPVPTPLSQITHGVYCDEFAEFQTIDMHARQYSKSFVPSNGVGTGFAREILDQLARERGEIFDAASLTEDYEIGVYIHASKFRQTFVPLTRSEEGELVATREYFPHTVGTAIRQRTRWVTGIALQCWERRGWRGGWRTRYWFWRDRKGLAASPLSLLTNILFLAGMADWIVSAVHHRPWMFALNNSALIVLSLLTTILQCFRIGLRMVCVGRIFGPAFAMGVPLRVFHGNLINCCASMRALWSYAQVRRNGRKHVWLKTEHAYPNRDALVQQRGHLDEVLLQSRIVTEEQVNQVRPFMSTQTDIGNLLLLLGLISEEDLCRARSLHAGVISGPVEAQQVKPRILRTLPRHLMQRFGVLPVSVNDGRLLLAGACVPEAAHFAELRRFCALPIDFQLITKSNFDELAKLA